MNRKDAMSIQLRRNSNSNNKQESSNKSLLENDKLRREIKIKIDSLKDKYEKGLKDNKQLEEQMQIMKVEKESIRYLERSNTYMKKELKDVIFLLKQL